MIEDAGLVDEIINFSYIECDKKVFIKNFTKRCAFFKNKGGHRNKRSKEELFLRTSRCIKIAQVEKYFCKNDLLFEFKMLFLQNIHSQSCIFKDEKI